jgi:RNA polymerase sigma-70 factor, ECF subfamily
MESCAAEPVSGSGGSLRVRPSRDSSTPADPGPERALVLRVQRGDTAAFEELVRSYVRRARSIALRLMRDPDDADDLVQDAFLRALERIETFDPDRAFGPWFFRLLVNAGLDTHRRRKLRRTEPDATEVASAARGPEQAAEQAEIRERFSRALDGLPPRQRHIVWAFEVDGLTTREIARSLGLSEVTVRWHLHTARRTLRAALADLRP